MTKENYLAEKNRISKEKSNLVNLESALRKEYINFNKPFSKGCEVKILTHGDRVIKGKIKDYSIGKGLEVFVSTIKPEGKPNIYISLGYKSIELISEIK